MTPGPQKTWLVIGASRGIGHEFVRQALIRGDQVFATVRKPTSEHNGKYWMDVDLEPSRCSTLECDVTSEESIKHCVSALAKTPDLHIDYAVINAGVLKYPNRATEVSFHDLAFHLHTNTIGPIICAQQLLKASISIGSIVFISSDSGSVSAFREHEDGFAAYGASKAALNQMGRHMAAELKRKGSQVCILMLHPGEVMTDMAADVEIDWEVEGQMTTKESVAACIETIESKGPGDSGTFWQWDNKPHPW